MPKIAFNGSPWDGVEIDAPFYPDQIPFRNLDIGGERVMTDEGPRIRMSTSKREHWVYLLELRGEECQSYRYAPSGNPWWEKYETKAD